MIHGEQQGLVLVGHQLLLLRLTLFSSEDGAELASDLGRMDGCSSRGSTNMLLTLTVECLFLVLHAKVSFLILSFDVLGIRF